MAIDFSTTVKQANDQVSCSLNEEIAILNLNSGIYYGLEHVGGVIWEQLKEKKTVKELCRIVTEQFDVAEDECASDVIDFLNNLANVGLVDIL